MNVKWRTVLCAQSSIEVTWRDSSKHCSNILENFSVANTDKTGLASAHTRTHSVKPPACSAEAVEWNVSLGMWPYCATPATCCQWSPLSSYALDCAINASMSSSFLSECLASASAFFDAFSNGL